MQRALPEIRESTDELQERLKQERRHVRQQHLHALHLPASHPALSGVKLPPCLVSTAIPLVSGLTITTVAGSTRS